MNRKWTYLVAALAMALALVSGTGCEKLKARDDLNKGVQAFRNAQVFRRRGSASRRPSSWIRRSPPPGSIWPSPTSSSGFRAPTLRKTSRCSRRPRNSSTKVLQDDPKNSVAIEYMAQLNYSETQGIKDLDKKALKLDEAKEWNQKLSDIDPKNKEAFYSLGVIAWTKWYPTLSLARAKAGMKPEDPGPLKDKKAREELRTKYWDMINTGIENLKKRSTSIPSTTTRWPT